MTGFTVAAHADELVAWLQQKANAWEGAGDLLADAEAALDEVSEDVKQWSNEHLSVPQVEDFQAALSVKVSELIGAASINPLMWLTKKERRMIQFIQFISGGAADGEQQRPQGVKTDGKDQSPQSGQSSGGATGGSE